MSNCPYFTLEERVDMPEHAFECFLALHLQFLGLVHLNGDAMKLKMKMDRRVYLSSKRAAQNKTSTLTSQCALVCKSTSGCPVSSRGHC